MRSRRLQSSHVRAAPHEVALKLRAAEEKEKRSNDTLTGNHQSC
jgi:hypothetical protein